MTVEADVEELDVVRLEVALPGEGLPAGSVGTVVTVFEHPHLAYEVEFCNDDGKTIALVTLDRDQIRKIR